MLKRTLYLIMIIPAVFFICSCGNERTKDEETRGPDEIWMQNLSFVPETLKVSKGTEVTWANIDSVAHTVTSADTGKSGILFDSGSIGIHRTFSHKFDSTGIYHYYCKIHAKDMNGVIIVK